MNPIGRKLRCRLLRGSVALAVPAVYGLGCVSGPQLDDFARAETARVIANFLAVPGQLALQDFNNRLTAGPSNAVETAPSLD